ncbi:MAG: hypothetical protein HBSAPP03_18330 [Phycisphaerae bacterium]|nr:MAG: hypothetical protein HBSAPP03_18330 [Phycisphaerae bacterium]
MSGHNTTPEVHEHADSWHHHEATEGLPQTEHLAVLNVTSISIWGAFTTVALVVVMVALGMYFSSYTTAHKQDKEERQGWQHLSAPARAARDSAEAVLSVGAYKGNEEYSWSPEGGDRVQIPIGKAMEKVVADYAKR